MLTTMKRALLKGAWELNMASLVEVVEGLKIIVKHCGPYAICAEHDIIYAGGDDIELSLEEIKQLEDLSWHFEDGVGWGAFV